MAYRLRYTKRALADLGKLSAKDRAGIVGKIEQFAAAPHAPHGFAKRLVNRDETRLRFGDYRALVIVKVTASEVIVVTVRHRSRVY